MNRSRIFALAGATLLILAAGSFAQDVESLRGATELVDAPRLPTLKRWEPDQQPIARDFVQQPPLVPHSIDSYNIDLRSNKCLTCHSWANYQEAGATKISQTHFADSEANVLANVAPRRYFCNQCHVPQMDTDPLVENTFEPVKAIQ